MERAGMVPPSPQRVKPPVQRQPDPVNALEKAGGTAQDKALGALNQTLHERPQVQALQKLGTRIDTGAHVAAQRRLSADLTSQPAQQAGATSPPNRTGLPSQLKSGIEALSGVSLDGVKVHYNSAKPAQLNALAYAQGNDIHLAPGQDRHLPHEAWHVVQQAQGRVRPTAQMQGGVAINNDAALEREADVMGTRALARAPAVAAAAASQLRTIVPPKGQAAQSRADMAARGIHKRSLQRVRRILVAARDARGNGPATEDEIGLHDRVQNAGQHHGVRNVTLNQLIGDINASLQNLTALNLAATNNLGAEVRAGRGGGAVAVQLKAAALPEGKAAVVQLMLIKVKTQKVNPFEPRRISAVQFEGRVPTTVSSGQGDHTVSEALMELHLERFCLGRTHAEVAQNILKVFVHLQEDALTKFKSDKKMIKLDIGSLEGFVLEYQQMVKDGADGEDLNEKLSDLLTMYLRLWNKTLGSAYSKSDKKTFGGGDEKQGKKEINEVLDLEDKSENDGSGWKMKVARAIVRMVDFNAKVSLEEAARHLSRALEILFSSDQEVEEQYNDVATYAVQIYAQAQGLGAKEEEALDKMVFEHLRGPDSNEDDMLETDN